MTITGVMSSFRRLETRKNKFLNKSTTNKKNDRSIMAISLFIINNVSTLMLQALLLSLNDGRQLSKYEKAYDTKRLNTVKPLKNHLQMMNRQLKF